MLRFLTALALPLASEGASLFGTPAVSALSASCATIDFTYQGPLPLKKVFILAKHHEEWQFIEWGDPVPVSRVHDTLAVSPELPAMASQQPTYRALMRHVPPGTKFQVKVAGDAESDLVEATASAASEEVSTREEGAAPARPSSLEVHRTDPRLNVRRPDNSVCLDFHWSHPHPMLHRRPDDTYFRIYYNYDGEDKQLVCHDQVGSGTRSCGAAIDSVSTGSELPTSFVSICGLRPNRPMNLSVEAFNCDGQKSVASIQVVTPPKTPNVVGTLVMFPAPQESDAGFQPYAALDWPLDQDNSTLGHVVYLGLVDVGAMKLLCWAPKSDSNYMKGHIELPVVHRNHTYSEDTLLLLGYQKGYDDHMQQELLVAAKSVSNLESPLFAFRLGEWLVDEAMLKCLTTFDSKRPSYAARSAALHWTQEEALSMSN